MRIKNIIYTSLALTGLLISGCSENESLFVPNDFSDIAFINTQVVNKWSTHILEKGIPISFMDLSQNALSHSWTIDDGCCFIKGEFNKADTVFEQFIIPDAGKVSNENIVHVLFQEPGTKTVRLTNTFRDKVVYDGLSEAGQKQQTFPGDPVKESFFDEEKGVWVFDTLMHFKILDYVTADITMSRNNEELLKVSRDEEYLVANSSAWDKLSIEVGEELTISADIYGEPDENFWKLNTGLAEIETKKEIINEDPKIIRMTSVFQAAKISEGNLGYLSMERKSKEEGVKEPDKPASKQSKYIPLKVNIIAPTTPFVVEECKVVDMQAIQLSFKSTLKIAEDKLQEYLGCFTVISDEYNVEISDLALNETSNALILNLMNPVYKDEEIKVSYRGFEGNPIVDIYDRTLQNMVYVKPKYFDPVITDPVIRGFEGEIKNDKSLFGWYLQHFPVYSVCSDFAYSGNRSLLYDSNKAVAGTNYGNGVQCQTATAESELNGPAGDYIVEGWIYIKDKGTLSKINFVFQFPSSSQTLQDAELNLGDKETDKWIKVSAKYRFAEPLVPGKSKLNILFPTINGTPQEGII